MGDDPKALRFNGAATYWSRKVRVFPLDVGQRMGASMGPRLIGRGKLRRKSLNVVGGGVLQWGRDLLVAERILAPRSKQASPTLQWGRDLLVAERRRMMLLKS